MTARQDLCHAGNDGRTGTGNAGLTADAYPRPSDDPWAGAITAVYFTCASEASPPVSYPCTGSKHVAPGVEIACSCSCHVVTGRLV